jgi:hypothetical protein
LYSGSGARSSPKANGENSGDGDLSLSVMMKWLLKVEESCQLRKFLQLFWPCSGLGRACLWSATEPALSDSTSTIVTLAAALRLVAPPRHTTANSTGEKNHRQHPPLLAESAA